MLAGVARSAWAWPAHRVMTIGIRWRRWPVSAQFILVGNGDDAGMVCGPRLISAPSQNDSSAEEGRGDKLSGDINHILTIRPSRETCNRGYEANMQPVMQGQPQIRPIISFRPGIGVSAAVASHLALYIYFINRRRGAARWAA